VTPHERPPPREPPIRHYSSHADRALESPAIAKDAHIDLWPTVLTDYIAAWHEDLARWRRHIGGITPRQDLPSAGMQAMTVGVAFPPAEQTLLILPVRTTTSTPSNSERAADALPR